MIDEFFLVFPYSSFELIYQSVDRGVHVFFRVFAMDRTAIYFCGCFSLMAKFFYGQDTLDVRHEVKVSCDFFNFRFDIVFKRSSNFDVMA